MAKLEPQEKTVAIPSALYDEIGEHRDTIESPFGPPTIKAVVADLLRTALDVKRKRGRT